MFQSHREGRDPRRQGQQKRGSCAHTHAPRGTGPIQHSPAPGAHGCSTLHPAFPAFLTSVLSAPPRMTFSCSLTLPSQFPPQGLCMYSYCLSTYPPCAHICACVNTQTHTHITFSASGRSTPSRKMLPSAACLPRRHSAPAPVLTSPHHGNSVAKSRWWGKGDTWGRQRGTQQHQLPGGQFGNKPCITSGEANLTVPGLEWTSFFGEPTGLVIQNPGFRERQVRVQVQTLLLT